MRKIFSTFLVLFALLFSTQALFAQATYNFITFGKGASPTDGDDNNFQIFFIKIPDKVTDSLTLRLFDPDCGGTNDQRVGEWNTETEFRLLGGPEAYNDGYSYDIYGKKIDLLAGKVLAVKKYGIDPYADNEWVDYAKFSPADGAAFEGYHLVKLVVTGLTGDDGNVFNLFVSRSVGKNLSVDGVEVFSLNPTVRVDKKKSDPAIRFRTNSEQEIEVANFDAAGAPISLETPVRSNISLRSSGDGLWDATPVSLNEFETNKILGIVVGKGVENPNDITFYAKTKSGRYLPFLVPVEEHRSTNRPEISKSIEYLNDCYSVVLDASGTRDKDGDLLEYLWDFGDGTKGTGNRVAHTYTEKKDYTVKLLVTDNSGVIGNASYVVFPVQVNRSPKAQFTFKKNAAPDEKITFDGTNSSDEDGIVEKYSWDFGDASTGEGKIVQHAFDKPGRYQIELTVRDNSPSPCNWGKIAYEIWVNASPIAKAGEDRWAAAGEPISFDGGKSFDPDGKIVNYFWDFGDGSQGNGVKPTHTYKTSGRYTVTLKVEDDAGVANSYATDNLTVKVNFPPVAKAGKDQIVAKFEQVYFSGRDSKDEDGEITKYEWSFGDGSVGEGVNVSHAYREAGKYKVHLRVTDNSGMKSGFGEDDLTVTVNEAPTVTIGPDVLATESAIQFDGSGASDKDGSISRYEWDFGDGTKSNEKSPLHVYKNPGVYQVKLKIWDNTPTINNSAEASKKVTINAKPVADAGANKMAAPGQKIEFSGAGSFDPDGYIADYEWNMGDGTILHGKIVEHAYAKAGTYKVKLKVIDNTLQPNAINFSEVTATINSKPIAVAGTDLIVAPDQEFVLDGSKSFSNGSDIIRYEWEIVPHGGTLEGKTIKHALANPGVYFAILTITDNSGAINATAMDTIKIKVNSAPVANAGTNVYTCERKIVLDGSHSTDADGDPLNYSWNFGDGSPVEKGVVVTHTYKKGGTYPVILTVDDGMNVANSTSTNSITVKINEPPIANAGSDMIVCTGETVRFNGGESKDPEGGALKYSWDFGEGSKGEGMNPTKIYKKGGTYQVTLKVEDDSGLPCNSDVTSIVVVVSESPVAHAGTDMVACANAVVKFDGTKSTNYDGVVNSYTWDFGDGTVGGGAAPTHSYAKPGVYRVTLTITGDVKGECDNSDSDQITVTVFDAPKVDFDIPQNYPVGKELTLRAKAEVSPGVNITDYLWDFGDGTTGQGQTVKKVFTKYGNYSVKITLKTDAKTDCHSASTQKLIIANERPIAKITAVNKIGVSQPIEFSGSASRDLDGSIQAYEWNFGDGQKANGLIERHQYAAPGKYIVTLRVKDNTALENNFAIDTLVVRVNESPIAVADFTAAVCAGEPVAFDAMRSYDKDGAIKSYSWDFGDGYKAEGMKATHTYAVEGTYNVALSVDDGDGLSNSRSELVQQIKVNAQPQVVIGPVRVVCPNTQFSLTPKKAFDPDNAELSYQWKLSDGFTSASKELVHAFRSPGIYKAVLTVNDNEKTNCSVASDTVLIIVNTPPVAKAVHLAEGFTGGAHDELLFDGSGSSDADGDALNYAWDFGDGVKASGAKVYHLYEKPGTFTVRLTVTDDKNSNCSSATDTFTLTIRKH
jgi:PKD repeat protein